MKKHIQYEVFPVDPISVFNKGYYGVLQWFDGISIACIESETFDKPEDAWKWIAEELKKWERNTEIK